MKIEEILSEIILLEFSEYDTAKVFNVDNQSLRTQAQTPQATRVRDTVAKLRDDQRSTDPLIRRKVMLQKQLAQLIQQIKKRDAEQERQTASGTGNAGILT